MGKICKSASASRSGRGQRGAFSTRAGQGTRPRESTGDVGPYLALRSARRMAVYWTWCPQNGQNLQKCVSFEKRARPAWGVFGTRVSQRARPRESAGDVGPYLALRSARRMAVSWMRCPQNGQNRQKCVSFEKRARPAWGVFDTGKPGSTSS